MVHVWSVVRVFSDTCGQWCILMRINIIVRGGGGKNTWSSHGNYVRKINLFLVAIFESLVF